MSTCLCPAGAVQGANGQGNSDPADPGDGESQTQPGEHQLGGCCSGRENTGKEHFIPEILTQMGEVWKDIGTIGNSLILPGAIKYFCDDRG